MIKYFLLILVFNVLKTSASVLYPPVDDIGLYKPIQITPTGSICGLELKDTLCDNRLQDDKSCSNSSSIFYCDQSCPYGNVVKQLNKIEQLKLELMNPCVVIKDFNYLLSNSSKYSYYFDKNNNLCSSNNRVVVWRPFSFDLNKANPNLTFFNSRTSNFPILNSGFTFSLWFTQTSFNNGTLISLIQDDNTTVLELNIFTTEKKIYLTYKCDLKMEFSEMKKLCFLELIANNLMNKRNFLALRIHKNYLDLFINEPNDLNEYLSISSINLGYDLGSFIINNSKKLNFLIGTNLDEFNKYSGWIQDFKVYSISLVNSEIADLYGKSNESVKIQSECRCPNDYPRNENENSTFCIKNRKDLINLVDKKLRLNQYAHPLNYLNDDDFKTSWISCALTIKNPIEIILDLVNGVYLLQRIEIYFSSLPPTSLKIERLIDNSWIPLQSYSIDCDGSDSKCVRLPLEFDSDILGGYTVVWSAKTDDENSFFRNPNLVQSIKATKIKLIMSGYYPNTRKDIRKLYYAINELKIKGRCDCNGYSSICDMRNAVFKCMCDPKSNTQGPMCNQCQDSYNNRIYQTRYSNPDATCSKCNCNNRSNTCVYDPYLNSGSCLNCLNNTIGSNCEKCSKNYYFNKITETCEYCNCNSNGILIPFESTISNCDQKTGLCFCKQNVQGEKCDRCRPGYFNLSKDNILGCKKCDCNPEATVNIGYNLTLCDEQTGQCKCKSQFVEGIKCDTCMESMYNLELGCTLQCNCDPFGSIGASCDQFTGQCNCKPRISGLKCNKCELGYYNLTSIGCVSKCNCNQIGSLNQSYCDSITGKCNCKDGYTGKNCDICSSGYWRYKSECIKCKCNLNGVLDANNICEPETGKCICNEISEGFSCENCKPGYFGELNSTGSTCQKCNCDPIGTNQNTFINGNYICNRKTSQCDCNENRIGIRCETCAVGYFFLNLNGIDCFECNCDPYGSVPGSNCNSLTGECVCKVSNGIGGTRCDQCSDGYYNFSRATGSCSPCGCNIAGSIDQNCDQITGQCACKEFVTGIKCNQCISGSSNLDLKNPFGCSKSPSKQSPPYFSITNSKSILVNWNPPDYPNGIITYYLIYRNETLIVKTSETSYLDLKVEPFTVYSYRIEAFNDEGSTSSRPALITITLPIQPCCRFDYRINSIRSTQITVVWTKPDKLNGLNLLYFIRVYIKIDRKGPNSIENLIEQTNSSVVLEHNKLSLDSDSNYFHTVIKNLYAYTSYLLSIKACNRDLKDSKILYCLEGTQMSRIVNNHYIEFITSQDRPELQPEPSLISLNSSYLIVGVKRPLRPNGIILLYEIWIRNFETKKELACAIDDLYDPNDIKIEDSGQKLCMIKNLKPNTEYRLSASSSTIIGRSNLSQELLVTTLQNQPLCPPVIKNLISYKSDSIYFEWLPSLNQTKSDSYWINCLSGSLSNFTVYRINETKQIIYTGLKNFYNLTFLNASSEYKFQIELCNTVGCISTGILTVITIDPPPNPWKKEDFNYEILNSSSIKFDWSSYIPFSFTGSNSTKYRLEKSKISFSYPPPPLENGIRFHGFNYFKFQPDTYFPEGYPYFGLKYSIKTQKKDALIYFSASSYSQSELVISQVLNSSPWFISNPQTTENDECSIYLSRNNLQLKQNQWETVEAYRVNKFYYLGLNKQKVEFNSSCQNQVITDITGVYIGGVPDNFITRDESRFESSPEKRVQRNRFQGCLKNISTLLQLDNFRLSSQLSSSIEFNFSQAEIPESEFAKSNTIYGCPLNLDKSSNPVNLIGFGFLYINLKQTIPIDLQTNKYFILDFDFRTEYAAGVLFFNYDIDNNQYLIVRLVHENLIELCMKTRVRYNKPGSNDNTFSNYFEVSLNETFQYKNPISNGYWFNLNFKFDFLNRSLVMNLNRTKADFVNLISNKTVQADIDYRILKQELLFTFYLNVQFFFGGFDLKLLDNIFQAFQGPYITDYTRQFFSSFFEFIQELENELFFSGCMKNFNINSFSVDIFDSNNIILYKNVRFDGCPHLGYLEYSSSRQIQQIELVEETSDSDAIDSNFKPFTEYFYRVVSYNSQGRSASDWFLIRTPEIAPNVSINIDKYLIVRALSGYKIRVDNLTNFCFYCNSTNRINEIPFTGLITYFNLMVKNLKNYTFQCETVCSETSDSLGLIPNNVEPNSKSLLIDTTPITIYSLTISVCNSAGCSYSNIKNVTTLGEIPDGIYEPELINRTSNSLYLKWNQPKYPSGEITGFILRQIGQNQIENVLYFGLRQDYKVLNLLPLSNYSFSLEACNSIGCGRSSVVSYSTLEMAPLSVPTPEVLKITQTGFLLKLSKPNNDQIQAGFINKYVLFLNENEINVNTSCIECEASLQQIDNLKPGKEYFLKLSACTNGGCTNSSLIKLKTLEDYPNVNDVILKCLNKTFQSIFISWNTPQEPNGDIQNYVLFKNEKIIYQGLNTYFNLTNLNPNSYFKFMLKICNSFGCSMTTSFSLSTDEAAPEGGLILDAQAKGSNQIELKWSSSLEEPLKPNGNLLFSVYITGPFLVNLEKKVITLNLLNTTVLNTKYGILDRILPFSVYSIQVNASNTKGFVLSNRVQVETHKSAPDFLRPPILVYSRSTSLKLEWFEPILINSEDRIIFYQLNYKTKQIWKQNSSVLFNTYSKEIVTVFKTKSLANFYVLNNLSVYTAYSFQLIASNSYGDTKSDWSQDYYTLEEPPLNQPKPQVLNLTSKSVFLEWSYPETPNGIVLSFKLNIYKKVSQDMKHIGSIEFKNKTLSQNVSNLDPYSYYLFNLESCNSVGCASSEFDKINLEKNKNFLIQTEPFVPEVLEDPVLESLNSYSVEIKWSAPLKLNGELKYFILERVDYSMPLTLIDNKRTWNMLHKYKFEANKFKFVDENDLESCGLYSYRLTAYNQVGSISSNFVNITLKDSKPLIVQAPIINVINSSTVRFEWFKPLTYCSISSYNLIIKQNDTNKIVPNYLNNSLLSLILTNLKPFTIYQVYLESCVDGIDDCTSSLSKYFKTPGSKPRGLTEPVARHISPRGVSVQWLEPTDKNGEFVKYQLIRLNMDFNWTQNIYTGSNLYYLDTNVKTLSTYMYQVVYLNEFGSSVSNWSKPVFIKNMENSSSNLTINFNLKLDCRTPSSAFLSWDRIELSELVYFVKSVSNQDRIELKNMSILIESDAKKFEFLVSRGNSSLILDQKLITNLKEMSLYKFTIELYLNSLLITSETKSCKTKSTKQVFTQLSLNISTFGNYLNLTYKLPELIKTNYDLYEFNLLKTSSNFNKNESVDSKLFFNAEGSYLLGPFDKNNIYLIILKTCGLNLNEYVQNEIFRDLNCIESEAYIYSQSSKPPELLTQLKLELVNSTNVYLKWDRPLKPNGFELDYIILRRPSCKSNIGIKRLVCDRKNCCSNKTALIIPEGFICCENWLEQNETRFSIGPGDKCCNDLPYFKNSDQYCCNGRLVSKRVQIFNGLTEINNCPDDYLEQKWTEECGNFEVIKTVKNQNFFLDSDLNSSSSYDYNYCVRNNYDRTCYYKFETIKTEAIIPESFELFYYEVYNLDIVLKWNFPIKPNGPSLWFKLYRNGEEIYNGMNLFYLDQNLNEIDLYKYEIYACNKAGCLKNSNILLISLIENTIPEYFRIENVLITDNKMHLTWKNPLKMNGVLNFYGLQILELGVEVQFEFDFNSNLSKIIYNLNQNISKFSKSLLLDKNSIYELEINNLKPGSNYSLIINACNLAGCVTSTKINAQTKDSEIFGFVAPGVYNINDTAIDLVWNEPKELNGILKGFRLFRNGLEFKDLDLRPNLGFYSFRDSGLEPDSIYSYQLEVYNRNFNKTLDSIVVHTPPAGFVKKCSKKKLKIYQNSIYNSSINLLDVLKINFFVNSSNEIQLEYDSNEWKQFLTCFTSLDSSFTIKILIQTCNDLQTLDFPYPPISSSDLMIINHKITGLTPFNNYSIRISFSSNYPNLQIQTSDPVYLQTLEALPCCKLNPPKIAKLNQSNLISVRWSPPIYPNGIIRAHKLFRYKLAEDGCKKNSSFESKKEIELILGEESNFFYDSVNSEYVYLDSDDELKEYFSFYVYKIGLYNNFGGLESELSEPILSWDLKPAEVVFDLKLIGVYPNGFRIRFKEPEKFNGILDHYLINLKPISGYTVLDEINYVLEPVRSCKTRQDQTLEIEISLSGLESFKSYNLTILSVNTNGVKSPKSDYLIVNTLESSPKYLQDLSFTSANDSILVKFKDPIQTNGLLTKFILFVDSKLILKDLKRDFLVSNLDAYKNYTFYYEACTYTGCTRFNKLYLIQTTESLPRSQLEPLVIKVNRCFKLSFGPPIEKNGLILKMEIFRKENFVLLELNLAKENLIKRLFNIKDGLNSVMDCELESNVYYSYRIVSFNLIGSCSSNYTSEFFVDISLPEQFPMIKVQQLDENSIKLEYSKPIKTFGLIETYKIYRNSSQIASNPGYKLDFLDQYSFSPNEFYRYDIYACNRAGCSTSQNYSFIIITNNLPPIKILDPILTDLGPRSVTIDATKSVLLKSPRTQQIVEYKFYLNKTQIYQGKEGFFTLQNLKPFNVYEISLEACTFLAEGCSKSKKALVFITKQTKPTGLSDLKLVDIFLNNIEMGLNISWELPTEPNGILKKIELRRNNYVIYSNSDIQINSFFDSSLRYGQNYIYEIYFINEAESARIVKNYLTPENRPVLLQIPYCGQVSETTIDLKWSKPDFSNGFIQIYELKYRKLNDLDWWLKKIVPVKIDLALNSFQIQDLSPMTQYEFQIGACNKAGCGYSPIMNEKNCTTLESVPIEIDAPFVTEITDFNSNRVDLKINWFKPKNMKTISFNLYKTLVDSSFKYDEFYKPLNLGSKIKIYSGQELSYVDKNVGSFNTFDYFVEIKTKFGLNLSPSTRYRTRPTEPTTLIQIGSLNQVGNDSVNLGLKPPISLNGELKKSIIILNGEDIDILKERKILNSEDFLNFLSNVTLNNLQPDTIYEIKSKFCNQVSCLTSLQSIRLKTLKNDKIGLFQVFNRSPRSVFFKWSINYGNLLQQRRVVFQIKLNSSRTIYEGEQNEFYFNQAKPFSVYEFTLLAFYFENRNYIFDKKSTMVQTLSDRPLFDQKPSIKINSFENNTARLEIDWENTFQLNGKLKKFGLLVNDRTVYNGMNNKLILEHKINQCSDQGLFNVSIKLSVSTEIETLQTPVLIVPSNCSIDKFRAEQLEQESIKSKNWYIILGFVIIILLILIGLLSIVYLIRKKSLLKKKAKKRDQATISISSLQRIFMDRNFSFLKRRQFDTETDTETSSHIYSNAKSINSEQQQSHL